MACHVTVLRSSPPGVADHDAISFFEQSFGTGPQTPLVDPPLAGSQPPRSSPEPANWPDPLKPCPGGRNDWEGEIGIRFVANHSFAVTHLGRHAAFGQLREPATVTLWCAEVQEPIAEVEVGPSSPAEQAYAFEPLPFRAELYGGREYRLTQRCRVGMADRWPDAIVEVEESWHDPSVAGPAAAAAVADLDCIEPPYLPPWAADSATFVGGAYNFHGGYPSFEDQRGRRAGMVNFKIARHIACLPLEPTTTVMELKAALQDATGLPPARQKLTLGGAPLVDSTSTLADSGVHHGTMLTLEMQRGALAATCAGRVARIWGAEDGACVHALEGHEDEVVFVEFSPNSLHAATGSRDCTARVWSAESGECLHVLRGHVDRVTVAAFRPSVGDMVLTASWDQTVRLWDTASGQCLRTLRGHTSGVVSASWSVDGTLALSASQDGTGRLWSLETVNKVLSTTCLQVFSGHRGSLLSATISSNCAHVLTAAVDSREAVKLWSVDTGQCRRSFSTLAQVRSVALSPDGTQVAAACCDHAARVFSTEDVEAELELAHDAQVVFVAYSGDGSLLATVDAQHCVWVWNLLSEAVFAQFLAHENIVTRVIFSLDGSLLLTASTDGTAKLWDVNGRRCARTLDAGEDATTKGLGVSWAALSG